VNNDIRECVKQLSYEKSIKVRTASTRPSSNKWDESNAVVF